MLKTKMVGVISTLLVGVAAVTTTTAQAEPRLYAKGYPVSFEAEGGTTNLNTTGGNNIECKSMTANGSVESGTAAAMTVKFKGCSKGCKTEGAAIKEIVLLEIPLSFVLWRTTPTHGYALLVSSLVRTMHCTSLTALVKGGIVLPTTLVEGENVNLTNVEATQNVEGVQSVTTCEEPAALCSAASYSLTANFGSGVEEASFVGSAKLMFGSVVTAEG